MRVPGPLVLVFCLASPVGAQEAIALRGNFLFYGDNTEFSNPFRRGETLLGVFGRLFVDIRLNERASLQGGIFGNQRFGDSSAFHQVRPVLTLTVGGQRSRFIFGTLDTVRRADGIGPDRTGPHGLLPAIQRETLAFTRPYEAGVQWILETPRMRQDAWLHWGRLNTPRHRERFDAGIVSRIRLVAPLSLGLHAHIVHHGGQLFAPGPVSDSYSVGPGVIVSGRVGGLDRLSIEAYGLVSRHVPDREQRALARNGIAMFMRFTAERAGWRGHVIIWRACDFIKEEGDPNYQALRLDGTRFRAVRDYGEAGLARLWRVAPDVAMEASARAHRTENFYEYSYRILGMVRLGWPLVRP
jgi:hypothetical protein